MGPGRSLLLGPFYCVVSGFPYTYMLGSSTYVRIGKPFITYAKVVVVVEVARKPL